MERLGRKKNAQYEHKNKEDYSPNQTYACLSLEFLGDVSKHLSGEPDPMKKEWYKIPDHFREAIKTIWKIYNNPV